MAYIKIVRGKNKQRKDGIASKNMIINPDFLKRKLEK